MIIDEAKKHPNSRVAKRPTEGSRAGSGEARATKIAAVRRGRGRPAGVKNKSKSLIPTELAEQLLLKMESMVPPEHFKYLKGVIKDGKAVSTKQELDTLILLLNRNLWPALVSEGESIKVDDTPEDEDGDPDAIPAKKESGPVFRKDVTERLKVLNSLLTLRHQIEKNENDPDDDRRPLLEIFASRGVGNRIGILIGNVPAATSAPAVPERVAYDDPIIIDAE